LPPLYAWLAVASGLWFVLVERHPSGQAIFLHKFVQYPSIYLGVGLYVLSGMLFSGTRLAALAFDVVRPFRLPPPLLCWLTGVAAAVPTAYSGASGIFVIAAGREIYDKLRLSGASRRLAWAATAMSGSLGVVLRPCLLVVLIAALNKQVTTDALFGRGLQVFALTSAIYGAVMLLRVRRPFLVPGPPLAEAAPASLKALLRLLPYLGVGGLILAGLGVGLGVWLNEFTAPLLVPLVLMGVVAWESRQASREAPAARFLPELRERLRWASLASSGNVGALLLLMSASIGLGGVIERAEWMRLLPQVSGSPFATMALLVVVLVLVGMIMDPMGAVVLVSVTIAGKAQEAGIDPVHFWMVVLVAFELGYLTPPVALNQLLTRQVVGAEEGPEAEAATGFLTRYDHVLTPVAILGIALLLVAFVPLWLGSRAGG
jgi:TRAP-type C4-dicarboxylate transport system permease large subunit